MGKKLTIKKQLKIINMKINFITIPSLIFIFIVSIFFYLLLIDRDPSEIPSVLIDKKIPEFKTNYLSKNEIFISPENFSNRITLVNFFATWCKPCRDEHKYIKELSKKMEIEIIGINYKDDAKKTIKWLNELGNPYSDVIVDKNGKIGIEWGVYGIPETFIVDSNKKIQFRHVGPINKKILKNINLKINEIKKND